MEADRLDPQLTESSPWLVRLFGADERVVGAGVLVDAEHVLTCAHVVEAVLEPNPDDPRRAPQGTLRLDFPSVRDGDGAALARSAGVLAGGWFPARDDGSGDIAILELAESVDPHAVPPAPLRAPRALSGRPFSARGYPTGAGGVEATGELRGFGGPRNEWVQIENVRLTGARVEQGFSGGPVYATDLGAVVGMVVAERVGAPDERIAHMIPVAVIVRYWAPLAAAIRWRLDLDPELRTHWLPRARGVEPDAESAGWYFTGRGRILSEVAGWLAGDDEPDGRVRLVTGAPGSGKSAVLARLVVLADPILSGTVPLDPGDEATRPPAGAVDLAVHAKGRTLAGIIAAIAASAEVEATNTDELIAALKARAKPFTIVVDALDEAVREDVFKIANLLARLARDRDRVGIRVLVGARSGVRSGVVEDVRRGLDDVVEVRVDEAPYLELADLETYVARRLLLADSPGLPTSYRGKSDLAGEVATAVAARAHPLFLVAQLTALRLVDRAPIDTTVDGWATSFPTDVGGAFDLFLDDLMGRRRAVREVLTALAYAEGDGLPERGLWAAVASTISGREYHDADVLDAIDAAASFLVTSTAPANPRIPVHYRLFHQALDDHLRRAEDEVPRQHHITDALLGSIPRSTSGERDWAAADPYVTTNLATHADRAGRLDELLSDPSFVVAADLDRMLPLLPRAQSAEGREWAVILELASDRLRVAHPEERPSYLELVARQRGADSLADRVAAHFPDRPWRVPFAIWRTASRHVTLTGSEDWVTAVAFSTLDGRPVALSSAFDGTIRMFDVAARAPIGEPLTADYAWGKPIAFGTLEGRPVAVIGGDRSSIHMWDVAARVRIGKPTRRHRERDGAVAFGTLDGRPIAISGSDEGTVRVSDVTTGKLIGKALRGHEKPAGGDEDEVAEVGAVAFGTLEGRAIAISGGNDGTVRVWDVTTGKLIGKALRGHEKPAGGDEDDVAEVDSVAFGTLEGRAIAISGGNDGTVRVWDVAAGKPVGKPMRGHRERVRAVAFGTLDGRPIAISGGSDGTIRMWDVAAGTPIGEAIRGHEGMVSAVAFGTLEGRAIAISGGNDGTVRVWDLATTAPSGSLTSPTGQGMAIALGLGGWATQAQNGDPPRNDSWPEFLALSTLDGRPIAMRAETDGTVRMWDIAAGGTPIGETLRIPDLGGRARVSGATRRGRSDRDRWVNVVGLGTLGGRPVAASSENYPGIRVWDLAAGRRIGKPLNEKYLSFTAVAFGTLDGRPVVVCGDRFGTIRMFDLEAGTPIGEPQKGHRDDVAALALGILEGRPVAISGGRDGTVRMWDFADGGRPIGETLTGHNGPVSGVSFGTVDGRPIAVSSGGRDSTIRLWDLIAGAEVFVVRIGSHVWSTTYGDAGHAVAACASGIVAIQFNPVRLSLRTRIE